MATRNVASADSDERYAEHGSDELEGRRSRSRGRACLRERR